MTLDEEMKLWEVRSNDKFGSLIKKIDGIIDECTLKEDHGSGIKSSYLAHLHAVYCLDGNVNNIMAAMISYLENYDYICMDNIDDCNYPEVANLIKNFKL